MVRRYVDQRRRCRSRTWWNRRRFVDRWRRCRRSRCCTGGRQFQVAARRSSLFPVVSHRIWAPTQAKGWRFATTHIASWWAFGSSCVGALRAPRPRMPPQDDPASPPANVHDSTVRAMFSMKHLAQEFFRTFLPKELLSRIDLSTLELRTEHFHRPSSRLACHRLALSRSHRRSRSVRLPSIRTPEHRRPMDAMASGAYDRADLGHAAARR